ncbi:MAG: hypothetical protein ACR2FZ_09120 [Thermoleophilaceae bacterium]|nr:hypothetical protein [Thermoleophilaceae bacterium]
MAREVKAKKRCCGSTPRCKRCGVVLKRLTKAGLAERRDRRLYVVEHVPKKRMKKVRAR